MIQRVCDQLRGNVDSIIRAPIVVVAAALAAAFVLVGLFPPVDPEYLVVAGVCVVLIGLALIPLARLLVALVRRWLRSADAAGA